MAVAWIASTIWVALGGSATFEPALFVANLLTFFGLLTLAYKTTKALKARVDLIVAVVGTEYELELRDEQRPGSSSPPKSTGEDVEQELQAVELRAEQLLQFWILFGLIQFFASYGFVYAVQFRAALVLFAALPHIFGAAWIAFVFDRVAPPVFGVKIPATIRWIRRKLRQIGGAGSPLIRWVVNVVLPADVISAANTQDLIVLEADLEDALKQLSAERKRRRRMQARLSSSPEAHHTLEGSSTTYRLDPEDEHADLMGEFGDFEEMDGQVSRRNIPTE